MSDSTRDPMVAALTEAVVEHVPADDREVRSRAAVLVALERLPRPFDRHADPTHVTASAVVVGPRGVLLHRHRRLHRWMQPGGHLDPGESADVAAVRETREETGLVARHPGGGPVLVHVDVHGAADDHVHLDIRYLLVIDPDDDEPRPPPGESQDVAWFTWEEAGRVADDALAGALRSARRLSSIGPPPGPGWTAEESDG
jgi:8-oxo-dGTP pyrophosphatase MutT (NUDIX family)